MPSGKRILQIGFSTPTMFTKCRNICFWDYTSFLYNNKGISTLFKPKGLTWWLNEGING